MIKSLLKNKDKTDKYSIKDKDNNKNNKDKDKY